nr:glycoside hydrolase family 125 protein [Actinomyces faecalis]
MSVQRQRTNPAGPALREALESWARRIATQCGDDAAQRFTQLMLDTWETTMTWHGDRVFVITGDIPAMWLRDSSAQVLPFMRLLDLPEVERTVRGLVAEQWRCISVDPYANAFNAGPTGAHFDSEDVDLSPDLWERKYEIDSLAFPIRLADHLWRATADSSHLDATAHQACQRIVDQWELEQDHSRSTYRHIRPSEPIDTLPREGRGAPVAVTGMTWSGFRPSDDASTYGYNIPAQLMAVSALRAVSRFATELWHDDALAQQAARVAQEIADGVESYGRAGERYLYEVDGLGGKLAMDDANMPSLLSLPLTSDISVDDPSYRATRQWVLSEDNPFFYQGTCARGIGSPHTPDGYVWHIALAVQGLTGDLEEARECLAMILATDAGTGMTHESFHPDDPTQFTRAWFSWSNSMACELMMDIVERS